MLSNGGDLVRRQAISNMILVAIADADVQLVEALLTAGADPNEFSLSTAVVNGNIDIVRLLLNSGTGPVPSARCIKHLDSSSDNVLFDALLKMTYEKETCLTILQMLLDSDRFNILSGASSHRTAFWRVLESSDWEPELQNQIAFMMLNSVGNLDFACNGDDGTLMHHIVQHGRKDMADFPLDRGANINTQDNEGRTPFISACSYNPHMITFLLKRGADPNLQYKDGRDPLHAAAIVGNFEALEELWNHSFAKKRLDQSSGDGWTPLACALAADHENVALFLISLGSNMKHTITSNGRTMLHLATAFSYERVFEHIKKRGDVDVNVRDNIKNETPLLLVRNPLIPAVYIVLTFTQECAGTRYKPSSTKIIAALLGAGADLGAAGSHLDRPLHIATITGRTDIVHVLTNHGANLNAIGSNG